MATEVVYVQSILLSQKRSNEIHFSVFFSADAGVCQVNPSIWLNSQYVDWLIKLTLRLAALATVLWNMVMGELLQHN